MKKFVQNAWSYKLAIFIGVLFCVNATALSITSAFQTIDWIELTSTQKFTVVVSIIATATNTILAFMNKTLARIEAGKPPIETGDSTPPFISEPKKP